MSSKYLIKYVLCFFLYLLLNISFISSSDEYFGYSYIGSIEYKLLLYNNNLLQHDNKLLSSLLCGYFGTLLYSDSLVDILQSPPLVLLYNVNC